MASNCIHCTWNDKINNMNKEDKQQHLIFWMLMAIPLLALLYCLLT